jgi:hypothetical protein
LGLTRCVVFCDVRVVWCAVQVLSALRVAVVSDVAGRGAVPLRLGEGDELMRLLELRDLVDHFTLAPGELGLLRNKAGATRLGFGVLGSIESSCGNPG